ncbi:MAG: hypothetical protein OEW19_13670 [Acidobacteriota bacterium]|nr:hypothetical protein [Acidobacteriota bacterium]
MSAQPPVVSIGEVRAVILSKLAGLDEWIRFFDNTIARLEEQGASATEIDEVRNRRARVVSSRDKLAAMDVFVPTMCCDQFMNCPPLE